MAAELQDADDILDYGEEEVAEQAVAAEEGDAKKGHYVGIHASGFRDFLLKPELLRAVVDNAFEHPSEVQHECIPQALNGMDVICQAKSGMGKTAVFVLTTLHLLDPEDSNVQVLVLTNVRELAFQICVEYQRFSKFMPGVKAMVVYGGVDWRTHAKMLEEEKPQIVVGTPGRMFDLINRGALKVDKVKHFVLDECDRLLEEQDMRSTVQNIFVKTPLEKQVMMFSATLKQEIRPICRKFMQDPLEIYVDSESKLTLHGLQQYYVNITEEEKTRKLNDLLDALEFNQVVIFVSSVSRAKTLNQLLNECNFPSICVHGRMPQPERIEMYNKFKKYESRILVSTDLFGRGIDIERVNIVINYDFPNDADQYLHRVGRAGRFGTKGLAVSFITTEENQSILDEVQKRFEVSIPVMPAEIDSSSYMS